MEKNCIQLEMNFNGSDRNQFRFNLDEGVFQVLAEIPLPDAENSAANAVAKYSDYEYVTLGRPGAALAFINDSPQAAEPVSFAAKLCRTDRDRHVLYLSGRDAALPEIYETAKVAAGEGFKNFCCVSGLPPSGKNAEDAAKHRFTESLHQLMLLKNEFGDTVNLGCAVNPCKYVAQDLCAQYNLLVKKLNNGADFAVTQYGWDMQKLHELRCYLTRNSIHTPAIARLLFLTPERAEDIYAGRVPGVRISPDLEQLLKREMQYSRAQFEAAQLRRLQLHAAGAKFLGYSGVQLSGVHSPEQLETLLNRIFREEFPDYASWLSAYREYYDKLDMTPYPHRFYLFENLLKEEPDPCGESIVFSCMEIPEPDKKELFRYKMGKLLFSRAGDIPASERKLTKKLLFNCKGCDKCRLPETFYICPETCPVHRANGPCGESNADGSCCFAPEKECIFLKQVRLAFTLRTSPELEEHIVPAVKREREVTALS